MSGDLDATGPDRAAGGGAAAAEARVASAAEERRRLRRSERRWHELTAMGDVLIGAAESSATVSLGMRDGRSHACRILGVGDDVVVAHCDGDRWLVLGPAAIRTVTVHRESIGAAASGGRRGATWPGVPGELVVGASGIDHDGEGVRMAAILAHWLAQRPRISVGSGGDRASGTLVSVGPDVAALAADGSGTTIYVRLDSTTEISVSFSSSL